jgi:PBP1b-binding outer membrane lipoprotein LpoB
MIKYYMMIIVCLILASCVNIYKTKEKREFHNPNTTFTVNECVACHPCILKENSKE